MLFFISHMCSVSCQWSQEHHIHVEKTLISKAINVKLSEPDENEQGPLLWSRLVYVRASLILLMVEWSLSFMGKGSELVDTFTPEYMKRIWKKERFMLLPVLKGKRHLFPALKKWSLWNLWSTLPSLCLASLLFLKGHREFQSTFILVFVLLSQASKRHLRQLDGISGLE